LFYEFALGRGLSSGENYIVQSVNMDEPWGTLKIVTQEPFGMSILLKSEIQLMQVRFNSEFLSHPQQGGSASMR
jgi:hypothetical protein